MKDTLCNIVGEHMMPHSLKSKNAAVIQTFIISTSQPDHENMIVC